MTDAEFLNWLAHGGRRVALVEVDTDTPRYLCNIAYTTLPSDTPANRAYLPCVESGVAFTERLSLDADGNPSISSGDIDVANDDGALDGWLNDVWVNRAVRVYIGDVTWPKGEFRLVFSGVCADLTTSGAGRLNISLRSKLERLNTPVTEALIGGTSANKDRITPLGFGECHNISPVLVDEGQQEFQASSVALERIIEARSNGAPLTIAPLLASGKFRMTTAIYGQITASVQFGSPYINHIAGIIQQLATSWGTPSERLTSADIDAANFAAFGAANPQPVGVYLADRSNVMQICQQLAASVGGQLVVSSTGLLRLIKVQLPGAGTPVALGPADWQAGSLTPKQRPEVIAGVKLGYARNWTVQTNLETGIPPAHAELYGQEWLTVTARNAAVATAYRLQGEPPQADTLLLREADAQTEANRRLALWSTARTVFALRGYAHLLTLELGQSVTLTAPRWGLAAGKAGQIVGLQRDWLAGRVDVEVLI